MGQVRPVARRVLGCPPMIRRRMLLLVLLTALASVLLVAGLAWARLDRTDCDRFYFYSPQHGRCVGNLEFDSPVNRR